MIVYRNHKPNTDKDQRQYNFTNHRGEEVKDAGTLAAIQRMAIPPAYTKVKIDLNPCAKIIFEGYDNKNRLQQRYSSAHNAKAKKIKFCRLMKFGAVLPKIQADIKRYLAGSRINENKVISIILQIIWKCGFRVGNMKYLHLYESHGISNIHVKHIQFISKTKVVIEFKGKKSVMNRCEISNTELVGQLALLCKGKKPTEFVFMYRPSPSKRTGGKLDMELIKSTQINKWLARYGEITSKDLRTFDVNVMFIDYMRSTADELPHAKTPAKRKKIAKRALIHTSGHINNTPGICKSSYLMTELYVMYVEQPRKFKRMFMSDCSSRTAFVNYLKTYCG